MEIRVCRNCQVALKPTEGFYCPSFHSEECYLCDECYWLWERQRGAREVLKKLCPTLSRKREELALLEKEVLSWSNTYHTAERKLANLGQRKVIPFGVSGKKTTTPIEISEESFISALAKMGETERAKLLQQLKELQKEVAL